MVNGLRRNIGWIQPAQLLTWSLRVGDRFSSHHIQIGKFTPQVAWDQRTRKGLDRARLMEGVRRVDPLTDHQASDDQ